MENRMTIEELQKILLEEQQARREAQHRVDEAERQRQREQQARRAAQHRADKAEHRADEAEQQTRHTTLAEYIEGCHELVFTKITVETDRNLTTTGSRTNPQGKLCPRRLSTWLDFLEEQKTTFGTLYSTFPT